MESKPETVDISDVEEGDSGTGSTGTPSNERVHVNDNIGIVEKDHAATTSPHLENGLSGDLSPEHRDYLMARHGTNRSQSVANNGPCGPPELALLEGLISSKLFHLVVRY